MRKVMRSLGVALGVAIACGCGSDGLPDISAVAQAYCERELSCESDAWVDKEGCEQVATSIVAGFGYVYGVECREAWLGVLDCDSFRACDDIEGCDPENAVLDAACGFLSP